MKIRKLLSIALGLAVAVCAGAQSASEIAAAKAMAKQYGYSENDINSMMNGRNGGNQTGNQNGNQQSQVQSYPQLNAGKVTKQTGPRSASLTGIFDPTTGEMAELMIGPDGLPIEPEETKKFDENDIYGQDYFKSRGLGVIPSYNAPAPASYILGPGDEVTIDIWGSTVSHVVATIENDGSINLPDLGPAYLAGMSLQSAENSLKAQLARVYSGLGDDSGETYLKISVGKIKGVVVNVSGEVETPGAYTIPSLSTISSAIFMAGGLREKGSVRNIALYRRGKKVAVFDLYDFIFNGKYDERLRLQDGDVIMVPAYTNVVSAKGAVMRPQRYEMKDGENVLDLIGYAQGFSTDAQRTGVNVMRKGVDGGRAFDIAEAAFTTFILKDGDIVSVREYVNQYQNRVEIIGPVKYPGSYAIGDGINDLASLVKAAGGLIEGAYTGRGQISRQDKNRQPEFLAFDLTQVLEGGRKIELHREDVVTIYSFEDMNVDRFVTIGGAVEKPGVYSYRDSLTVGRLINDAGGLTLDAYIASGQITREGSDGHPVIFPFDVQKASRDTLKFEIIPGDAVRIYSIKELRKNTTITINGEVNAPGEYVYRDGMTLVELVELAHGCTRGVDLSNVEIAGRGGRERGSVRTINLEENTDFWREELMPYDVVSFRRLTYFRPQTAVTVDGEVMAPGTYVIDKAQVRLSDVMARVGGFTDDSYPHGAKLVRVLTEEEQERQKLALEIAASKIGSKLKVDSLVLEDRYNIGIDLERAMANPGSVADVILRAGDIIEVPQMNNTVKISGGVLFPNTVAFNDKEDWTYYISQAGGYTRQARAGKTYAVYMNGQVAKRGKIKAEPGMEIIVPERSESENTRLSAAEIASLASSATSVAALVTSIIKMF